MYTPELNFSFFLKISQVACTNLASWISRWVLGSMVWMLHPKASITSCQVPPNNKPRTRCENLRYANLQCANRQILFQDKYFGRRVRAGPQFRACLKKFLYNGVSQKSILRHVPKILERIAAIKASLNGLTGTVCTVLVCC